MTHGFACPMGGYRVGTSLGLHKAGTVVVSIALAFLFGCALTMRGVLRAGLSWRAAVGIALAADTVSIAVMELIDNTAMLAIPGAMGAGVTSGLFWGSLVAALAVAFVVTTPVNRWLISRGKGNAVVRHLHHQIAARRATPIVEIWAGLAELSVRCCHSERGNGRRACGVKSATVARGGAVERGEKVLAEGDRAPEATEVRYLVDSEVRGFQ